MDFEEYMADGVKTGLRARDTYFNNVILMSYDYMQRHGYSVEHAYMVLDGKLFDLRAEGKTSVIELDNEEI